MLLVFVCVFVVVLVVVVAVVVDVVVVAAAAAAAGGAVVVAAASKSSIFKQISCYHNIICYIDLQIYLIAPIECLLCSCVKFPVYSKSTLFFLNDSACGEQMPSAVVNHFDCSYLFYQPLI